MQKNFNYWPCLTTGFDSCRDEWGKWYHRMVKKQLTFRSLWPSQILSAHIARYDNFIVHWRLAKTTCLRLQCKLWAVFSTILQNLWNNLKVAETELDLRRKSLSFADAVPNEMSIDELEKPATFRLLVARVVQRYLFEILKIKALKYESGTTWEYAGLTVV